MLQFTETLIDFQIKSLHNAVKIAEQAEKMTVQVLDIQRKQREEGLKLVEKAAEQAKQNSRVLVDLTERWMAFHTQNYKQASKATVDQFNKQVAQFSKS